MVSSSSRLRSNHIHLRRCRYEYEYKWSPMALGFVLLVFVLPLVVTYWHICQWLAAERCVLRVHRNTKKIGISNSANSTSTTTTITSNDNYDYDHVRGLACQGRSSSSSRTRGPYFIDTSSFSFSQNPPPSIAGLATMIGGGSNSNSNSDTNANANANSGLLAQQLLQQRNNNRDDVDEVPSNAHRFDYAQESPWPFSSLLLPLLLGSSGSPTNLAENQERKEPPPSSLSSHGFRRNPNKNSNNNNNNNFGGSNNNGVVPIATYFWLALNVGLYAWYWHHRVDPGSVALDGNLLGIGSTGGNTAAACGDFGRAVTGNLAHFEIWHLGLNAMSLLSLGESLETSTTTSTSTSMNTSSIGLFLWTASFLALTTAGVVGLYGIQRRLRSRQHQALVPSMPSFPSMVGFSGVLFCWSVAVTLSLPEHAQTCPIPVLSTVCFQTHGWGNSNGIGAGYNSVPAFRFSWAPLVQLAVVQVLLPRASFAGHLSGLLVGFVWHWGLLPDLEWSQPCVLYPLLWGVGKHYLYCCHCNSSSNNNNNSSSTLSGEGGHTGHVLGGGSSNNSSSNTNTNTNTNSNRWGSSWAADETTTIAITNDSESENNPRLLLLLQYLRNAIGLHWMGMVWIYVYVWTNSSSTTIRIDSIVVSELLLVGIFVLFVRSMEDRHRRGRSRSRSRSHGCSRGGSKTNHRHPFSSVGILGRAYVAFVTVTLVTDSMTLGGWLATFPLWQQGDAVGTEYAAAGYPSWRWWWSSPSPPMVSIWSVLVFLRFAFWVLSVSLVCCALDRSGDYELHVNGNGSDSDSNKDGGAGIWTHVFGWSIVGPCKSFGTKALAMVTMTMTTTTWKQQRTGNSNNNSNIALVTTGGGNHTSSSKILDRREISARRAKLFSARSTSSTSTGIKTNSSTRTSTNTTAANRGTTSKNTTEKPGSSGTSTSEDASSLV